MMQPRFQRGYPRPNQLTDAEYAERRLTDRTYVTKSFTIRVQGSRDYNSPARYVMRVFDDNEEFNQESESLDWTEALVSESPGGRVQVKIQVAREAGRVRLIEIQKLTFKKSGTNLETIASFKREDAARLVELLSNLEQIPVEGAEKFRLPDEVLDEIFQSPGAIEGAYRQDPRKVRALVEQDVSAEDIAAIAHRREIVDRFETLLTSPDQFSAEQARLGDNAGPEQVWQRLFEEESWLLGVGLSEQLLTSWHPDKLEQVVAGSYVAQRGKRVDALMKTNGVVQSLVFAEIKHHNTALLEEVKHPYRPACWAPSKETSGGVTQIQQTVYHATRSIGEHLNKVNDIGDPTGQVSYLVRPRCYLIVGSLSQLEVGPGSINEDKFRSFELYRRNLYEPIVITFDELLARARCLTDLPNNADDE